MPKTAPSPTASEIAEVFAAAHMEVPPTARLEALASAFRNLSCFSLEEQVTALGMDGPRHIASEAGIAHHRRHMDAIGYSIALRLASDPEALISDLLSRADAADGRSKRAAALEAEWAGKAQLVRQRGDDPWAQEMSRAAAEASMVAADEDSARFHRLASDLRARLQQRVDVLSIFQPMVAA